MKMKICGCHNVRKHRDIKGSDNYINLEISLKFDILNKMNITSSWSKVKLGILGKRFIASIGLKAKARLLKYKKARYAIGNISKKDLKKIIREFEKYLMKVMRRIGQNMSLMKATFTQQDNLRSL